MLETEARLCQLPALRWSEDLAKLLAALVVDVK